MINPEYHNQLNNNLENNFKNNLENLISIIIKKIDEFKTVIFNNLESLVSNVDYLDGKVGKLKPSSSVKKIEKVNNKINVILNDYNQLINLLEENRVEKFNEQIDSLKLQLNDNSSDEEKKLISEKINLLKLEFNNVIQTFPSEEIQNLSEKIELLNYKIDGLELEHSNQQIGIGLNNFLENYCSDEEEVNSECDNIIDYYNQNKIDSKDDKLEEIDEIEEISEQNRSPEEIQKHNAFLEDNKKTYEEPTENLIKDILNLKIELKKIIDVNKDLYEYKKANLNPESPRMALKNNANSNTDKANYSKNQKIYSEIEKQIEELSDSYTKLNENIKNFNLNSKKIRKSFENLSKNLFSFRGKLSSIIENIKNENESLNKQKLEIRQNTFFISKNNKRSAEKWESIENSNKHVDSNKAALNDKSRARLCIEEIINKYQKSKKIPFNFSVSGKNLNYNIPNDILISDLKRIFCFAYHIDSGVIYSYDEIRLMDKKTYSLENDKKLSDYREDGKDLKGLKAFYPTDGQCPLYVLNPIKDFLFVNNK